MTIAIFIFWGVVLGIVTTTLTVYKRSIGVLRIVVPDTDEAPYLFLELSKEVETFRLKRYVVLKIDFENYLSRK